MNDHRIARHILAKAGATTVLDPERRASIRAAMIDAYDASVEHGALVSPDPPPPNTERSSRWWIGAAAITTILAALAALFVGDTDDVDRADPAIDDAACISFRAEARAGPLTWLDLSDAGAEAPLLIDAIADSLVHLRGISNVPVDLLDDLERLTAPGRGGTTSDQRQIVATLAELEGALGPGCLARPDVATLDLGPACDAAAPVWALLAANADRRSLSPQDQATVDRGVGLTAWRVVEAAFDQPAGRSLEAALGATDAIISASDVDNALAMLDAPDDCRR